MDLLRKLADGGRTVITVTHSIQSLDRCDRILFLAPGGQTAFFGPPPETLQFFSRGTYAEVFQDLDRAAPGFAQNAFAGSPADQQYVQAPLGAQLNKVNGAANAQQAATPAANPHWGHQLSTLFRAVQLGRMGRQAQHHDAVHAGADPGPADARGAGLQRPVLAGPGRRPQGRLGAAGAGARRDVPRRLQLDPRDREGETDPHPGKSDRAVAVGVCAVEGVPAGHADRSRRPRSWCSSASCARADRTTAR